MSTPMLKLHEYVDELDEAVKEQLEPGAQKAFATLREQFRVFNVLQKPNVIKDGEVAIGPLNRALRRDSGFGKTARLNRNPTNPATKELFDVARYGADASLQPFRSSDTAQKIAGMEIVKKATNPLNWIPLGREAMATPPTKHAYACRPCILPRRKGTRMTLHSSCKSRPCPDHSRTPCGSTRWARRHYTGGGSAGNDQAFAGPRKR